MFTFTALRNALLEWQTNKGVHLKPSKSKLKVDRPDRSNYFNYKNGGGKNASCCAAMGRNLLISPGVADTYIFLMNTWNTLPESYQQRVYQYTLAPVKRYIQQVENLTPAVVISLQEAHVDNAILRDHLTSKVALEQPGIRSTDPDIPIENNCTDDRLHLGMAGGSGDYKDEGDESDEGDSIPTASGQWLATTELERFDLGTSEVDWYEGKDDDNVDADEEAEALQADDVSMQNVEDWGHSTRECEDWTVYFRPVQYEYGKANAMASDVSEVKTVLEYVTTSQC